MLKEKNAEWGKTSNGIDADRDKRLKIKKTMTGTKSQKVKKHRLKKMLNVRIIMSTRTNRRKSKKHR